MVEPPNLSGDVLVQLVAAGLAFVAGALAMLFPRWKRIVAYLTLALGLALILVPTVMYVWPSSLGWPGWSTVFGDEWIRRPGAWILALAGVVLVIYAERSRAVIRRERDDLRRQLEESEPDRMLGQEMSRRVEAYRRIEPIRNLYSAVENLASNINRLASLPPPGTPEPRWDGRLATAMLYRDWRTASDEQKVTEFSQQVPQVYELKPQLEGLNVWDTGLEACLAGKRTVESIRHAGEILNGVLLRLYPLAFPSPGPFD